MFKKITIMLSAVLFTINVNAASDGELVLKDGWHGTPSLINITGKINRSIQVECNENVYTYQIKAVTKNILENKKKPSFPGVTSSESLENMRILDNWLN